MTQNKIKKLTCLLGLSVGYSVVGVDSSSATCEGLWVGETLGLFEGDVVGFEVTG